MSEQPTSKTELYKIRDLISEASPAAEWGCVCNKTVDQHASDFSDSLREGSISEDGHVTLHGVYLKDTDTVICHTGNGPHSEGNAKLITFAVNNLSRMVDEIERLQRQHDLTYENGKAEGFLEREELREQLKEAETACDEWEIANGDAPHRAVKLADRIRVNRGTVETPAPLPTLNEMTAYVGGKTERVQLIGLLYDWFRHHQSARDKDGRALHPQLDVETQQVLAKLDDDFKTVLAEKSTGEQHAVNTIRVVQPGDVRDLVGGAGNRLVVDEPLSKATHVLSGPHLSGYRVEIGFETLAQASEAHQRIVDLQRVAAQNGNEQ